MHGAAANGDAVLIMNARENGAGIDNIADIARPDGIKNLFAAFAQLAAQPCADAVLLEKSCGARRCFDIEAELIEALDQRQRLLLILIRQGDDNRAVFFHFDAGGLQGFVKCAVETIVIADCLAR